MEICWGGRSPREGEETKTAHLTLSVLILLLAIVYDVLPRAYSIETYNGTTIYLMEKTDDVSPVILFFNGGFGTRGGAKLMLVRNSQHFNISTASFVYGQSSFGGKEVNDALNAVNFFENQNRSVILMGLSHGAYLSLMTGTFVNCTAVISLAGPSNLLDMEEFSLEHLYLPIIFSSLIKMTANECSGIPSQTPLCYQKRSPSYRTDLMNCPVLLLHGINDNIVPSSQSITMANSLNSSNKPYELFLTNSTHLSIEKDEEAWKHICEFVSDFGIGCEVSS